MTVQTFIRIIAIACVLYVPVMAVVMAGAMGWLFTPGRVDWAGPPSDDPFTLGYRGDPEAAFGLPFEAVSIPTELGPAESWLVPAGDGPLWAIYVHGIGGLRENGYRQLSVLHEAGLPTIMLGYRNDPWGPPGAPPFFSFGLSEWRDVEAAVDWARGQGAERIVMVAESMGGGIAGQFLMHSAEAGAVEALVLDAPAVNTPAIVRSFTRRLPFGGAIEWLGFQLARAVLPVDLETAVSADAVRDFPGPMFLAHGTADVLVPVDSSRALVAARADPRDVYLETGAQHLRSWQADTERYRGELLGFLAALK